MTSILGATTRADLRAASDANVLRDLKATLLNSV
jgi:hypothetical protein